jgi:hypothetical protein
MSSLILDVAASRLVPHDGRLDVGFRHRWTQAIRLGNLCPILVANIGPAACMVGPQCRPQSQRHAVRLPSAWGNIRHHDGGKKQIVQVDFLVRMHAGAFQDGLAAKPQIWP